MRSRLNAAGPRRANTSRHWSRLGGIGVALIIGLGCCEYVRAQITGTGAEAVLPPQQQDLSNVLIAAAVAVGTLSVLLIALLITGYRHWRRQGALRVELSKELDHCAKIEAALRASEARYRTIMEAAQDAVIASDPTGIVVFWNRAAERIFGYTADEAVGRSLFGLIVPPQYHEQKTRGMERFAQTGTGAAIGATLELTALRKGGEEFPIEISVSAYHDGTEHRGVALIRDITERKRDEEDLALHRTQLEAVNALLGRTLECDTKEAVARICLRKAKELTGSQFGFVGDLNEDGCFDVLSISKAGWDNCRMDADSAAKAIRGMELRGIAARVFQSGQTQIVNGLPTNPDRLELPPGHPALTDFLGVPLRRGDKTVGMIGLANKPGGYDETDAARIQILAHACTQALQSKEDELRLKRALEFQQTVVDTAATALFTVDTDQVITEVNDAFCHTLGFTREELIGKHRSILHGEPCGEGCGPYNSNRTDPIFRKQCVVYSKNGRRLTIIKNANVFRDHDGRIAGGIESFVDVTDLVEAHQAAEAATQAKSDFLANMSHEIRTPMTAILGFAETLTDPNLSPSDSLNAAHTIRRNGEHLLTIINDILDLSKIEAGRMQVEQMECSPCQVVAEVASLMGVRAGAKEIAFEVDYLSEIPEKITTDPTRLRQILINLVGNAIKFTEQGCVRLTVRYQDGDGSPHLQFDTIDTGVGMTAVQAENLFQPFMQADASTTRKFGGTGLGLSVSKHLAQMLGGDVTLVQSVPQAGTHFRVTIATGSLDDVRMIADPQTNMEVALDSEQAPAGEGNSLSTVRILLAEDGADNQRLISHILRKAGAEVAIVENGALAVEAALAAQTEMSPFDVVLMDMQMPVMDGYEAVGLLRQRGYKPPIIALTAHAMASDRDRCLQAGCDDYATKPIDRRKLVASIQQLVRRPTASVESNSTPDARVT